MTVRRWQAGRWRKSPGWWGAVTLALLLALVGGLRPATHAQEPGPLLPFEPVRGVLSDGQPSAE
ncbi:MAG: hypothetical protein AB1435_01430, partial [Chloroflexota bacterium]